MTYLSKLSPAALVFATGMFVGVAQAAAPFSFEAVEFMPREQRVPAARAFLAQNLTVGMAMPAAIAVVRRAGGYCRAPLDGRVECTHSSFQRPSGQDLQDVLWKVDLVSAPDGTLAAAAVNRTVAGA